MMPDNCALVLVDIQNDFLPQGAFATQNADRVIPVANRLSPHFETVLATQDWHPVGHGSFASKHRMRPGDMVDLDGIQQVLWPDHCVQGTWGADFPEELELDRVRRVFRKGTGERVDSYSGFFDNGWRRRTGLEEYLKENELTHLYVMGLVTDYCVKYTVLDGLKLGFDVALIVDGCCPVNLQPGDEERAIDEMRDAGAEILTSQELLELATVE